MTPEPSSSSGRITAAEPQLFVTDLAVATGFYTGMLGFGLVFTHGEPPFYAQVARGGARLNLRQIAGPVFAPDFRVREPDVLAATPTLEDAEPLFREYEAVGATFYQRLRTEPWGARTFIVPDPDGNMLLFAGR